MEPETRYARSGEVHIAYQVVGEGPIDLIYVPTWISQVEHYWEEPRVARFFQRLLTSSTTSIGATDRGCSGSRRARAGRSDSGAGSRASSGCPQARARLRR